MFFYSLDFIEIMYGTLFTAFLAAISMRDVETKQGSNNWRTFYDILHNTWNIKWDFECFREEDFSHPFAAVYSWNSTKQFRDQFLKSFREPLKLHNEAILDLTISQIVVYLGMSKSMS